MWIMIDPASGNAPPRWQSTIGPVLLAKMDGTHLRADDVAMLTDYIGDLLDCYGEGGLDGASVRERLRPAALREYMEDRQGR
jgi:hypothetical protein